MSHSRRRLRLARVPGRALLGGFGLSVLVALCIGVLALSSAGSVAASDDTQVKSQVTAYFKNYLQMWVIPTGETQGRVSAATLTSLNHRAAQLTSFETGDLLTSETQSLKRYIAELGSGDPVGIHTGGAVDSIAFDGPALVTGSSALISGKYSYHFDSYHMENGARVPDGLRGTDSFTVQVVRLNGVWLVASSETNQLDVQANFALPQMQVAQPAQTGPQPTKLPPPSTGVKKVP